MAISGRHFQFVQGVDQNAPTDCVCSGVPCAAVGGFAALRMRRAPMRVVTALYRAIQPREGTGAPLYHPDVSSRGAKRRGNLAVPEWIIGKPRRKRNCLPEIATSASGLLAMTIRGQFHFNDALF